MFFWRLSSQLVAGGHCIKAYGFTQDEETPIDSIDITGLNMLLFMFADWPRVAHVSQVSRYSYYLGGRRVVAIRDDQGHVAPIIAPASFIFLQN